MTLVALSSRSRGHRCLKFSHQKKKIKNSKHAQEIINHRLCKQCFLDLWPLKWHVKAKDNYLEKWSSFTQNGEKLINYQWMWKWNQMQFTVVFNVGICQHMVTCSTQMVVSRTTTLASLSLSSFSFFLCFLLFGRSSTVSSRVAFSLCSFSSSARNTVW